jgi:GTP-binding protein EngB required for normal cell division
MPKQVENIFDRAKKMVHDYRSNCSVGVVLVGDSNAGRKSKL